MSNLYADKVFSEHPLALWPMDDDVSYVSLISETQRGMASWSIQNAVFDGVSGSEASTPFPNSVTNSFTLNTQQSNTLKVFSATSSEDFFFENFNQALGNFGVGVYFKSQDPAFNISAQGGSAISSVHSYQIGYSYLDTASNETIENFKSFYPNSSNLWVFGSETFPIPKTSGSFKLVLRVEYSAFNQELELFVNGISLGQNCEEYSATSLGSPTESILGVNTDSDFFGPQIFGVRADQYGLGGFDGYYLTKNNSVIAKSSGLPMVFGERNSVTIPTGPVAPVIVFPSYGFLSKNNRYSDYSAEFWVKLNSLSNGYNKIFGPVSSTDGIYLDGQTVKILIGDNEASHVLESPQSPMLLSWSVSDGESSLLINGRSVISLSIDSESLSLSSESEDEWLAFFQGPEIKIDVDCLAIYSYVVPSIISKRRFVYGQAVDLPENSNSYYQATSIALDGASARYANNYSYPKRGKWEQGVAENVLIANDSLSSPSYSLPIITFSETLAAVETPSVEDWYDLVYENSELEGLTKHFDFQGIVDFLYFENLNILQEETKSFYCIFKIGQYSENEEVLLWLENKITKQYFSVISFSDKIVYRFFDGVSEADVFTDYVSDGRTLFLGIDFDRISDNFSESVRSFFGNKGQISVFVGGYRNSVISKRSFSGGIYRIGISDRFNFSKISQIFPSISPVDYQEDILNAGDTYFGNEPLTWSSIADGGVVSSFSNSVVEQMLGHVATYTVFPKFFVNRMKLEIASDSYWEDKLPLSYFGKTVKDVFGADRYGLDFLQINVSSKAQYDSNSTYEISENVIKMFVTFQSAKSENGNDYSYYSSSIAANEERLVVPGDEWINTKYEILNGSIVYPPDSISFEDLFIVTHIEMLSGEVLSNPLSISNLRYSSQALSSQSQNPISTKFGPVVYPFIKYGEYFDYKSRNPIRISPDPEPYLYANNDSGVEIVTDDALSDIRGISIPINSSLGDQYQIGTLQAFINFAQSEFPAKPVQIFEIQAKNRYWKFYVERTFYSNTRGRIYAVDSKTGTVNRNLAFYLNGRITTTPIISPLEWNILGVDFVDILDFEGFSGAWRITGPVKVNYLSYYKYVSSDNAYDSFSNLPHNRSGAIVFGTSQKTSLTAKSIFDLYTGTKKISNTANPFIGLTFKNYAYSVVNNAGWTRFVSKPV